MSLINDALKRAEESQPPVIKPSTENPAMRSVPGDDSANESRLWLPPVGGLLVLIAGLAVGIYFLRSAERVPEVRARTLPPATASATPAARETVAATQPAQVPPISVTPESVQGPNRAEPSGNRPAKSHQPLSPAAVQAPEITVQTATLAPASIAPVILAGDLPLKNLRLQAIIAHPTRPSAIVNGRTIFLGESIEGAKLLAVTTRSIKLSGPGGVEQELLLGK